MTVITATRNRDGVKERRWAKTIISNSDYKV